MSLQLWLLVAQMLDYIEGVNNTGSSVSKVRIEMSTSNSAFYLLSSAALCLFFSIEVYTSMIILR